MRGPAGRWALLLFLAAGGVGACVRPGPLPPVPRPALPAAMPLSGAGSLPVTSNPPWLRWWEVFHDDRLDRLVEEARAKNLDVREAAQRLRAARAAALLAHAAALPTLDANLSGAVQRRGSGSSRVGSTSAGSSFELYGMGLDSSWELDLFGRLDAARAAAVATARAAEADRRGVVIAVTAELANAWFDLLAAKAEAAILGDTIELLEQTLAIVEARFHAGVGPELDLRRVEGALATARARTPEARRKGIAASNRISLLLGGPPGVTFETPDAAELPPPPEIPIGLPSSLVRRRPDVVAAEERLLASHARVAEAIAEFYPSVTLAGDISLSTLDLRSLFTTAALSDALGPTIRIPIFEGGRLAAQKLERIAEMDAAGTTYAKTVLAALGEVADAVAGVAAHEEARDQLRLAVEAQRKAVEVSLAQYEAQLVNYLPVLDSQSALAEDRLALLEAERTLRGDVIRLGEALGGGW